MNNEQTSKNTFTYIALSSSKKVWKAFKTDQKAFHFILTFKILKQKLISKYMSSQTGKLTISLNILPNISRRKDNQKIIFCQLIE